MLSLRKSSIFPAPSRPVLRATTFNEARDLEERNSVPPKKLAKQVFNLLGKICELDAVAPSLLGIVFECHPEVSFWAMNNKKEMSLPKKTIQGFDQRCEVLAQHGYEPSFLSTPVGSYKEHGRDDLLDACVAAWTAERILSNKAIRFPENPDLDDRGIDMAIWA
jgi:predicted RNase H-like nuclease